MEFDIWKLINSALGVGGLGAMIKFFAYKKEMDAKVAKTLAEKDEIKGNTEAKAIKEWRDLVSELRNDVLIAEKKADECEYKHEVTRLEVERLKRLVNYFDIMREKVFVLDDSDIVTKEFQFRFEKISVIDCWTFTDADKFIVTANKERPTVLIIDHNLKDGLTAKQVLNFLTYQPQVIIMSGTEEVAHHYEGTGIDFVYKDKNYVLNIAKIVIKYLTNEVKNINK